MLHLITDIWQSSSPEKDEGEGHQAENQERADDACEFISLRMRAVKAPPSGSSQRINNEIPAVNQAKK
jgi:hypothetical protein